MSPSGPGVFCLRRLLVIDSTSLIDRGLFRLSISDCLFLPVWALADCIFQGIGPFNLGYKICGQKVIHNTPLWSFLISMGSVVMFLLSFLILLICILSLFFLVSLARGFSILLIYSKNQLLVLVIFLYWFSVFNFIDFCPHLFSSAYFGFNLLFFF